MQAHSVYFSLYGNYIIYCLYVYFYFLIRIIVCGKHPCVSLKFAKLVKIFTKTQ
jgi:hypothetical protein